MFGNTTNIKAALKSEMIAELKDILADDFDMLVDSFIEDAERRMQLLADAVSRSDSGVIRNEAHSLKGSSLNLGAELLPQLCSAMETKGKENDLTDSENLFKEIEAEFARVKSELNLHTTA